MDFLFAFGALPGFQVSLPQLEVHLGAVRRECHGALEVRQGLLRLAHPQVGFAHSVQRLGEMGVYLERVTKHREGLGRVALLKIQQPQVLRTRGVVRGKQHFLLELRRCLIELPLFLIHHPQIVVGKVQLGIECDRFLQLALRLRGLIEVQVRFAHQQMQIGGVTACADQLLESMGGILAPFEFAVGDSEHEEVIQVTLLAVPQRLERRGRVLEIIIHEVAHAQQVARLRVLGIRLEHPREGWNGPRKGVLMVVGQAQIQVQPPLLGREPFGILESLNGPLVPAQAHIDHAQVGIGRRRVRVDAQHGAEAPLGLRIIVRHEGPPGFFKDDLGIRGRLLARASPQGERDQA